MTEGSELGAEADSSLAPVSSPPVYVATLFRPEGETGVHAHIDSVVRSLDGAHAPVQRVTPFAASPLLVYGLFAPRRLLERVNGSVSMWWYLHWHRVLLERVLRGVLRRETRPLVIYAQDPESAAAALGARRSEDQRVVLVVHFNISQSDEWAEKGLIPHGGRMYRRVLAREEAIMARLDGIVYVSRFMQEVIERRVPSLREKPSALIPNFVEIPAQLPRADKSSDLVCVGALEPRKNQSYLLEILAVAARHGRRYTLTVIGDGPDRAALERRAAALGVGGQVRFLGARPQAAAHLPAHRLLCHVARLENCPFTIIEAMARGVPVAAAPVGGIPEMFTDGIEGAYLPLDDVDLAAQRLMSCLDDRDGLDAMARAARRRVDEQFNADVSGARLREFLYSV